MAIGPRLDLRQSQQLVMTPQLQQAIRLLALSNIEIETFIAAELEKNPLLELGDTEREAASNDDRQSDDPNREDFNRDRDNDTGSEIDGLTSSDQLIKSGSDTEAPLDIDHDQIFHHDCGSDNIGNNDSDNAQQSSLGNHDLGVQDIAIRHDHGDGNSSWEDMVSEETSLHDYLHAQAGASLSGDALFIGHYLIDMIDDNGYLFADLELIARQLGVETEMIEQALSVIHSFDPAGIGARSLAECLAIQAKEADRYDPAMARMLDNLDLLAKGRLPQLKRICTVDDEDMVDMIAEIRNYDPKPGAKFGSAIINSVIPDLFIREQKNNKWSIELNHATLPRLLINRQYHAEMSASGGHDKQTANWLNECLTEANWLIKALDQRQKTILKVASEIVKQQEGFFRHGVTHLRPLTLRHVAEAIEMHESTISRVTSNKYLNCARGTYELKYFFTSAIQSSDGSEAASAEAVKNALKELVNNETKILSDDKLVDLLKAKGFDIARRTVAKYREALDIGSSVQRRREKKLSGKL